MDCQNFYGRNRALKQSYVVTEISGESDDEDSSDIEETNEYADNESEQEIIETDEEDVIDIPGPSFIHPITNKNKKTTTKPSWKKIKGGLNTQLEEPDWLGNLCNDMQDGTHGEVRCPIVYFRRFITNSLLDMIVEESNLYCVQQDPNKVLGLTKMELEQFIGSLLWMSIVKLSYTRLYWKEHMGSFMVAKIFSRDRWETIKKNLHFNDNHNMPDRNDPTFDRLYKIRPLISKLKETFHSIPMAHRLCVDEQMIPFKGRSALKQYLPSKPHKWGYKLFVLSDVKGIVYDFEVYTGKIEPVINHPDLGASSNIVLRLARLIPSNMNHQLYFDNWFTSLPLIVFLAKRKIYCLGTVRTNRLPAVDLIKDKDLSAKGRGSFEEKETLVDGITMRVVKWYDNRAVSLISSFTSAEPQVQCQRYDKRKKENVNIPMPNIVNIYNSFMGGVDLLDSLISLYRIHVRSKKYYHKFFFHFLDMVVVNAWLLYKRDCGTLDVPLKERSNLQEFKMSIAESLILEGKERSNGSPRGRPSNKDVGRDFLRKRKLGHATTPIPNKSVRMDGSHHVPEVFPRQRCKNPGCNAKPVFKCGKCNVHLCITANKNCFKEFHCS